MGPAQPGAGSPGRNFVNYSRMSREPKFDTAHCQELDSAVSPYAARELYFNEDFTEYFGRKLRYELDF